MNYPEAYKRWWFWAGIPVEVGIVILVFLASHVAGWIVMVLLPVSFGSGTELFLSRRKR